MSRTTWTESPTSHFRYCPIENYVFHNILLFLLIVYQVDEIDVSAIPPSTLANSGLLMACLMVDGIEVASVNMVVNVTEEKGRLYREIYNPLA